MAEKKKMSVAEILAAARKADSKDGGAARDEAEKATTPPAADEPVTAADDPSAAASESSASDAAHEPTPAKPAAKPLAKGERPNVKDILAMARGGAKPASAAAKPAGEKAAPKAPPAAKPAAAKAPTEKAAAKVAAKPAAAVAKDTASILAAARKTSKPGPITKAEAAAVQAKVATPKAPAKEKPVAPPMPPKPAYAKLTPAKAAADEEDRRGFFQIILGSALALGMTALAVTSALWTLAFARFMFPNILTEPPNRFKVGFKESFAPGQVETKFVSLNGAWIVNGEYNGKQQIFALRTVCTHLGCTPNWLEAEQKFKCPCHGSGFYKDGINFEGPAPRPLERYAIRIGDDGQLEVDKSKLFQEELGQWADPASFVVV